MGTGKQQLLLYREVVVCIFPPGCQCSYCLFNLCSLSFS